MVEGACKILEVALYTSDCQRSACIGVDGALEGDDVGAVARFVCGIAPGGDKLLVAAIISGVHNLAEGHADIEGVALDVRPCRDGNTTEADKRRVGFIDEGETHLEVLEVPLIMVGAAATGIEADVDVCVGGGEDERARSAGLV